MAEEEPNALANFAREHLWKVLAAAFALYGGYLTGQNRTESDIKELSAQIARMEVRHDRELAALVSKLAGRHGFMNDAGSRVEFLCNNDDDCRNRYGQMRIPE